MITLLRDGVVGFPEEYLVARIRGRRQGRLDRMPGQRSALTDTAPADETAITRGHEAEVRWLYRQMNGRTRERVAPLFVLFELRRLVNWLRQADAREGWGQENERFLAQSLWHHDLQREWSRCGGARELLASLEKKVAALGATGKRVSRQEEHPSALAAEHRLAGAVLVHGATRGTALLRDLCRDLIDLSNGLGVVKSWLWQLPVHPPLIPAGHLSPAQFERIWREGDGRRLGLPAAGRRDTLTPDQIATWEEEKKEAIWRRVRHQAKLLDPAAVIMDYLCLLEAEVVKLRGQLISQPQAGNNP